MRAIGRVAVGFAQKRSNHGRRLEQAKRYEVMRRATYYEDDFAVVVSQWEFAVRCKGRRV